MNYQEIAKVNSEIKMLDLKGKNYAMVPERITAFRKLYPDGFIKTEVISHDGTTVLMQAIVGYYENGVPVILASGLAQEVKGYGMVNKTSYIENCETSAVGRALGMLGLGLDGGGVCSAEELVNAITSQNQIKAEENSPKYTNIPAGGQVEKASKLPVDPVPNFIRNEIADIQEILKIDTYANAKSQIMKCADALVTGGVVKPFDWRKITMEEAQNLFKAIRANFLPGDAA